MGFLLFSGLSIVLLIIAISLLIAGIIVFIIRKKAKSKRRYTVIGIILFCTAGILFIPAIMSGYFIGIGINHQREQASEYPLYYAAVEQQSTTVVRQLLDDGADPNENSALAMLCISPTINLEIAETLIAYEANVNKENYLCDTPLTAAIKYTAVQPITDEGEQTHMEMVKVLLENGADPNLQTSKGITPLDVVYSLNSSEAVRQIIDLLKEYGATEVSTPMEKMSNDELKIAITDFMFIPTWLPEGYQLEDIILEDSCPVIIFLDSMGYMIKFTQLDPEIVTFPDYDDRYERIILNTGEAYLYPHNLYELDWQQGDYYYRIWATHFIGRDDVVKIAESVKMQNN